MPVLIGEEATSDMEQMEDIIKQELAKDGIQLGKVKVSYIAGYSYDFLKKNKKDSMNNCTYILDLPTVKSNGHKFETTCGFTGKETNSIIMNIIDSCNNEYVIYKITMDVTYCTKSTAHHS